MSKINIRAGQNEDSEWLFELFRMTNREFIETSWGWDELLQRESFLTSLPGNEFRILQVNQESIGGYHLARREKLFWLELIVIDPKHQGNGYGNLLLEDAKETASQARLPIQLSVLKINPAAQYYLSRGFEIGSEDDKSYKLAWSPGA